MRALLSFISPLTAAVLFALPVRPAIAQQAGSPDHVRPVVHQAAAVANAPLRTLAVYRLVVARDAGMPSQVTVADSAGTLVASVRLAGARGTRPMQIDVLETDLVLQGETPSGWLMLQLYGQNDPEKAGALGGRWWLGDQQGELRGRIVR